MAIIFEEKLKKQKYLFFVLGIVILITAVILWKGIFQKEAKPPEVEIFIPEKKLEINFTLLKNEFLEQLRTFEKIKPLEPESTIGRDNPFQR